MKTREETQRANYARVMGLLELDEVELSLEKAIARAASLGDNDLAFQHTVTLHKYRDFYQLPRGAR
jgi:hypothetical protein